MTAEQESWQSWLAEEQTALHAREAPLRPDVQSDEQRVEQLNNTLQNMWRSGAQAGLDPTHPVMVRIDEAIAQWSTFKDRFNEALLERQFSAGLDLWGTNWSEELVKWERRVVQLDSELRALIRQTATASQAQTYDRGMVQRGEDANIEEYRQSADAKLGSRSAKGAHLLVAFAAVGGLIGAGVWLSRPRRRR